MSFEFESFRPKKYERSKFLDGRFLLSQEASDLQLELLEYTRDIVTSLFGDIAEGNGWLVQQYAGSPSELIVRPGIAYYNGLPYEMQSGFDPKTSSNGGNQAATNSDVGGKIMDFTTMSSGYYKIVAQAMEEQVTALQDTFLQGAAVPETTKEERRIIISLNAIACDSNGHISGTDPMNFANTSSLSGPQQIAFFSNYDMFKIPVTTNTYTPTTDTLGSTGVVTFSNDNGGGTIFPATQAALLNQIFTNGFLIDSNGSYFYITAVQISTGPDQIAFTISQQLAVPAGTGIESNPSFLVGGSYSLVTADLNNQNPSTGVPIGTRNYAIANVYWNGTNFSAAPFGFTSSEGGFGYNIQDLRQPGGQTKTDILARKQNWMLTNASPINWVLADPNDVLTWGAPFIIKDPSNTSLQYQIAAGNTYSLFGSNLAEDEVLYAVIPPSPTSGTVALTLQKDARGTNALNTNDPSNIYILAYRTGNIVYFLYDALALADGDYGQLGMGVTPETIVKVTLLDSLDTSLPSTAPATIDGEVVANGDLVLFTALTSPAPNRVYQATISGSSITWQPQSLFPTTPFDPVQGDIVQILDGVSGAGQFAIFNGSNFEINNVVRYFDTILQNFVELDGPAQTTLLNNSGGIVFSVTAIGSENMRVDFSISRGNSPKLKETGTLWITCDDINAWVASGGTYSGLTGINFTADVVGGNLRLNYNADSTTGMDATMHYTVLRWSDYAGGPTGLPSYGAFTPFGGGYVNSAYNMSQSVSNGYNMGVPSNVGGKTQVSLMTWSYLPGLNSGAPAGDIEVVVNGQIIPRLLPGITTDAYYTEINSTTIQFWTDIITPENVSIEIIKRQGTIDASSQVFPRVGVLYDAVVGSLAQVASGAANYSSVQAAVTSAAPGDKILVLQGTYTENVTVGQNIYLEGKGHGASITGTFDVAAGADYSTVKNLRFDGNFTIEANGCFIRECFQSAGNTITDSGTANAKIIIQES